MTKRILLAMICCVLMFPYPAVSVAAANAESVTLGAVAMTGAVFGELEIDGKLYGVNRQKSELEPVKAEIMTYLSALDQEISTSREDSQISLFNSGAAGKYEIGKAVYDMLESAKRFHTETGGYFDPTIYPLMKLWKLETGAWNSAHDSIPTATEIAQTLSYCGMDKLSWVTETIEGLPKYYVTKTDDRVQLDFGAQAKGYAADRVMDIIRDSGIVDSAYFSIAGNLVVYGQSLSVENGVLKKAPFRCGVMDCYGTENTLVTYLIDLEDGESLSLVSSGDSFRYYTYKGIKYCHIIDPHTGYPANVIVSTGESLFNGVTNATIFHESSEAADVYATAIVVMGVNLGFAWLEEFEVEALVFSRDYFGASKVSWSVETDQNGYVKGYLNQYPMRISSQYLFSAPYQYMPKKAMTALYVILIIVAVFGLSVVAAVGIPAIVSNVKRRKHAHALQTVAETDPSIVDSNGDKRDSDAS